MFLWVILCFFNKVQACVSSGSDLSAYNSICIRYEVPVLFSGYSHEKLVWRYGYMISTTMNALVQAPRRVCRYLGAQGNRSASRRVAVEKLLRHFSCATMSTCNVQTRDPVTGLRYERRDEEELWSFALSDNRVPLQRQFWICDDVKFILNFIL